MDERVEVAAVYRSGGAIRVAVESCNGIDDNCDDYVDNDPVDGTPWYADSDQDGYGDPATEWRSCEPVLDPIYVEVAGDCHDDDPDVNPLGEESCNGLDDDCNGVRDDGMQVAMFWPDTDGDGSGDPGTTIPSGVGRGRWRHATQRARSTPRLPPTRRKPILR